MCNVMPGDGGTVIGLEDVHFVFDGNKRQYRDFFDLNIGVEVVVVQEYVFLDMHTGMHSCDFTQDVGHLDACLVRDFCVIGRVCDHCFAVRGGGFELEMHVVRVQNSVF